MGDDARVRLLGYRVIAQSRIACTRPQRVRTEVREAVVEDVSVEDFDLSCIDLNVHVGCLNRILQVGGSKGRRSLEAVNKKKKHETMNEVIGMNKLLQSQIRNESCCMVNLAAPQSGSSGFALFMIWWMREAVFDQ